MPNAPRQPPPKKEVALTLLEESSMFIHLDPRRPGVVVPKWFMGQPQLVLQVGLNMAIPIPDLQVEEEAITCTLSFNRAPFWCRIPWTAVYALVGEDGRGGVWPDDVPPEIQLQQQKSAGGQAPKGPQAKRPRPRLAAVGGEAVPETPAPVSPETPTAPPSPPPRRGPSPVLRAVPAAEEAPAEASAAGAEAPDEPEAEAPEAEAPEAEQAPAPAAAPAGKKPKREIPPWLRVIK